MQETYAPKCPLLPQEAAHMQRLEKAMRKEKQQ